MSFRIRGGKSLGGVSFSFGKTLTNKPSAKEIKDKEFKNFLVKSSSDLNECVFSFIRLHGYDPKIIQKNSIDLDELFIGLESFENLKKLSLSAKDTIEKVIYSGDTGIKGKRDITDSIFDLKSFIKSIPSTYHKPPQQFEYLKNPNLSIPNQFKSSAEIKFDKTKNILLWIGIFFMPYIFSWFTLSSNFTKKQRIIAFCWMVLVVILVSSNQ